jgi:hypothetical protein
MILDSSVHRLSGPPRHEFDFFINATGFEERSASLVRAKCITANKYLSLLFDQHRVLAFDRNFQTMTGVSASFVPDPIGFFREEFKALAREYTNQTGKKITIGLDVSSMNRTMAATTLSAIFANQELVESLHLFYVPGKFHPPKLAFPQIEQVGAVTPELSGFDSEPALPLALVLGLGFEYGTAVGLINQLEPQLTLCLTAIGHDVRFEREVRRANLDFDFGAYNVEVSEYELLNGQSAYRHIENIVYTLVGNFRVVMVPMGPKVLASLLVLIALKYFGKIAVWRVAGPMEPTVILPANKYIDLTVDINIQSDGLSFDRLQDMIEGQNLEFLAT